MCSGKLVKYTLSANVCFGPKADHGKIVSYVRIVPEGEIETFKKRLAKTG